MVAFAHICHEGKNKSHPLFLIILNTQSAFPGSTHTLLYTGLIIYFLRIVGIINVTDLELRLRYILSNPVK